MRVIAGTARGISLITPENNAVRPTLDKVREALFSILGDYVNGARFLDLFTGTGANGIEALSRGARSADFVDSTTASLSLVQQNLERTHLAERAQTLRINIPQQLSQLNGVYDIVFADPPYAWQEHTALLHALATYKLINTDSIVVIEHNPKLPLPDAIDTLLTCRRRRRYGTCMLTVYA